MGAAGGSVKRTRAYDASRREAKARATRDRVVDIAEQRFLGDGYGPTTIQSIADDAGVSVDTIYKSFGGKSGLVRAIRDRALLGLGPVPAELRSVSLHADNSDGRDIVRGWGDLTMEIAPLVSPILLLVRDASAHDPEMRDLREELDQSRRERMATNARLLRDGGHLRPGITIAFATDVLWTYSAPELYELLVIRSGWSLTRYGRFVADAMIEALL